MDINLPEVLAEVQAVCARYEAALGDLAAQLEAALGESRAQQATAAALLRDQQQLLTEQQGANYFGALLTNFSSLCIWRAFSHPPNGHDMPIDQALYQFQRFAGWDAATQPNVVLQIKNGPYDL